MHALLKHVLCMKGTSCFIRCPFDKLLHVCEGVLVQLLLPSM